MGKCIVDKDALNSCLDIELSKCNCGILKYCPIIFSEAQIKYHLIHSLRKWEYYINCGNNKIMERIYRVISGYWQRRAGMIIPPNVVDMGLSIPHIGPIIINNYCDIGKNCRIHVGVVIGANKENCPGKCPVLGNNIYIGPGAKIFGEVYIADGVKIGANAVVNKSCIRSDSLLVGIPAEIKK